ncbi:cell division control protein Cdc6 [Haladaptatus sp. R4]|uniref:Cdc6/Cdc18 family protein n=1 Tax=Haladaptatus sp. R4 TaxID=1679489 RepID=UPI0007B4960E|nr:orc1/cdc6 family replication initiation protein [Haladaptatus sp. R4]KZN26156.1 cell division control protein Cdc6 [Haladaptatus sp. R4]
MSDFDFTPNEFPFKNRNVLMEDYTPNTLVGRDDELTEYHSVLQPAINGEQPNNIFLYGKTGVGKTAATRFLLDRLEQNSVEYNVDIKTAVVNCDGFDTSYRVAVHLVNKFCPPEEQISDTGYSRSQVYDALWNVLDSCGGIFILVLDEVDHLQDESILYQLSRARENRNIESARISVIGISNDLTFRDHLSPKTRSSLCERSISFSTYDANELQEVLRQRETAAFTDGALEDDVIPLCAAYGAQESGDARKALDLLLQAGDLARKEDAEIVTEDHVRRGRDELEEEEVAVGIVSLNQHEQLVLYALTTFEANEETPIRTRSLYERYTTLAEMAAMSPNSSRWMRAQCDTLEMLGLTESNHRNEGLAGGSYREHVLAQDLDLVVQALDGTIMQTGIHDSIEKHI